MIEKNSKCYDKFKLIISTIPFKLFHRSNRSMLFVDREFSVRYGLLVSSPVKQKINEMEFSMIFLKQIILNDS